jgi:hypothetical protein
MSILVYRYGLAAPHEAFELVEAQLRAAHEYRCALVRIERDRRAEEREARQSSSAELVAAEAQVRAIDTSCAKLAGEISAARKLARKRVETEEMRSALAAEREKLHVAKGLLFALRERQRAQCFDCRKAKSEIVPCEHAHPEGRTLRLSLDAVDLRAREKIREAYNASPAYWGTKLVVDKAMGASRAAPLYEKDGLTPHDPPFPRWDGGGCVAVQFQGGTPVENVFRSDNDRICIAEPPWPEEWLAKLAPVAKSDVRPDAAPDAKSDAAPDAKYSDGTPGVESAARSDDAPDAKSDSDGTPGAESAVATTVSSDPSPYRAQGSDFDPADPKPQPSARRQVGQRPDGTTAPVARPDGTPARWVADRAARHGQLRMCVATEGRGKTLCAAWRLDYDRPLPKEARVTWACVYRRMRGPHAEWSLCLTIEVPARETAIEPKPGAVAIDIGWRLMPCERGVKCHQQRTDCQELRVAAWQDDAGKSGELRLTAQDIYALRESSRIRSDRDVAFVRCTSMVAKWARSSGDAPEWLRAEAVHMHSWRRQARLVTALRRWEEERPSPTAEETVVRDLVSAWALADSHMWATERARDVWAHRRRRERYRVFAARMAENYGTIVLERFDLRRVAERAPTGEDVAENEVARSNRQLAAVSELRGSICHAVCSRNSEAVAVDATDSTRMCPSCGSVADRGQEESVRLVCECGHVWDQDREGAAPVLLRRFCERPGDAQILAGARAEAIAAEKRGKKGEKHARAKRMGKAKRARLEAARNVA